MDITVNMKIVSAGSLIAIGDVTLEHCINLHQVKVIDGKDGEWILSLPRIRGTNGGWYDTIKLSREQWAELKERICDGLREALSMENPFEVLLQDSAQENCLAQIILRHKSTGIELHNIQVRNSCNGPFVAFPKQRMHNDAYAVLVELPINVRTMVEQDILAKVRKRQKKMKGR